MLKDDDYDDDDDDDDNDELFLRNGWPTKSVKHFFCQRFSPLQISDMLRAEFEPAQSLSSGFVESSFTVVKILNLSIYLRLVQNLHFYLIN